MTFEIDGNPVVVQKMKWNLLNEKPLKDGDFSEDDYLYFAKFFIKNGKTIVPYVQGDYLGNVLEGIDDNGNLMLEDDIYAWSNDTVQAPEPSNEILESYIRKNVEGNQS